MVGDYLNQPYPVPSQIQLFFRRMVANLIIQISNICIEKTPLILHTNEIGKKQMFIESNYCKLPISQERPLKDEQPGPPVSQIIRGSFSGFVSDSTKQQKSCTSSDSPTPIYLSIMSNQNKKKEVTSELNLEMKVFFRFSTLKYL